MNVKAFKFFFFLILLLPLTGCGNVLYLSKLGWNQSVVTFRSVPVQEVLEDQQVNDLTKEKIRFIQEVKRHGEERLGLKRTKNYTTFYVAGDPILNVVTACEKDSLQLYHWNFPIVGKVTYKSFFTREGAQDEKKFLDRMGYDTFVQSAVAYSTLGWLRDPIFSSMLEWDHAALANVILHEMTHATIYFKGETDFNEQIATFIGNRGAIDFLIEKYGAESKELAEAIHSQEDDLLFSEWIDQACRQLSDYYAKEISRDEKLRGRETLFRSIEQAFQAMKGRFKTESYQKLEQTELNNAVLLAYRRYFHRLDKFEALYESMGRDLKRIVEFFKKIEVSGDKARLTSFAE